MNRLDFIGTGVAVSALAGSIAPAAAAEALDVDAKALDAFRNGVTAKHRQSFGSISVRSAAVLHHAANSVNAYKSGAMDAGDPHLRAAVILFGPAVLLGLDDAFWKSTLDDAYFTEIRDTSAPVNGGNPHASDARELIASGNAILICNNALHGVTGVLARRSQKTPAEIYARARANFIPGAILVPAGVAAVNALQESRFTYLQSA